YINDVSNSGSRGKIVCEATDSSYKTGGPGFTSIHQKWVRWRTPVLNEMVVTELCSNKHPLTLTNQIEVRVSNQRVPALMKKQLDDYAEKNYKNKNYTVFSYEAQSDDRHLSLTIDEAGEGYVWGKTIISQAGGVDIEPWTTTDENLDVYGSGHISYHADGHHTITVEPSKLPNDKIPEYVEDFEWD